MNSPTLSVVVPAYNNGAFIAETLQSILAQDGVDFELLVADHSSTDDTLEQIHRFTDDPRLSVVSTPAGGGAPANWRRVSELASGTYLKLVCGDDVLLPGILARQVALLKDRPGAVLTASRRDVTDAAGKPLIRGRGLQGLNRPMPGSDAVRTAVRAGVNPFGEPACVTMVRAAFAETGGWLADFPYLIDQATYSRVLMGGEFVPDNAVGATFRMSASQWSVALVRQQTEQARAYNAWLHADYPDVISKNDRRLGDIRVAIAAQLRRLAYVAMKRRM